MQSPGQLFRAALAETKPLQIVGTINAYTALMASKIGHKAIYISGGACANASYGLPDLGMTSMNDVLEDARRITAVVDTPLLIDIDTGWGGAFAYADPETGLGVAYVMNRMLGWGEDAVERHKRMIRAIYGAL